MARSASSSVESWSGGFLMDYGINLDIFSASISAVLSGFLWKVDLICPKIFPTICGFGVEICGWSWI